MCCFVVVVLFGECAVCVNCVSFCFALEKIV